MVKLQSTKILTAMKKINEVMMIRMIYSQEK